MTPYRLYLRRRKKIVACQMFDAEDDAAARAAAVTVFEACSERCDSLELWDGDRKVAGCTAAILAASAVRIEEIAAYIEEALLDAKFWVAHGDRMLERLSEIRGRPQK